MKLKRRLAFFSVMLVISVFLVSVSSCKGDGLEVDENGNLIDNSWKDEIPTGKTILAFDISGNYSIDSGNESVKNWSEVAVHFYVGTEPQWGSKPGENPSWPGLVLSKKCKSNSDIFWAEVDENKLGSGTCIFNNNNKGTQLIGVSANFVKGSRYIFRNGNFKEF